MFPRLFEIGRFSIPTYGFLSAFGLLVGLIICVKCARRDGIDSDQAWNLGIYSIIAAVIGSKLFLFVTDWGNLGSVLTHPSFNSLKTFVTAGGVWYGGVLVGSLVAILYMWRQKMPILKTYDAFVPGIAFGHIVGRIGCFAAGCCYGKPTTLPWGVTFTNPLAHELSDTPLNVPLHPTQLYEAAANTVIFFLMLWMWRRKSFEGQVLGAYFFTYGVARFFLEFFRDDPQRGSVFHGAMSLTQLVALCLVVAGGLLWLRRAATKDAAFAA